VGDLGAGRGDDGLLVGGSNSGGFNAATGDSGFFRK
jgi:hypothetical protein